MQMKKIKFGNPLQNLMLHKEMDHYDSIKTDSELAKFYHAMLDKAETDGSLLLKSIINSMISFSCDKHLSNLEIEDLFDPVLGDEEYNIENKNGKFTINGKSYLEANPKEKKAFRIYISINKNRK